MMNSRQATNKLTGFTLIEILLVVVVIGMVVSVIQFNFIGAGSEEKLKRASSRFAGVFDLAAEYSMLNNIEMGLYLEDNSYQFLGYDGVRWSELPENKLFQAHQLVEGIEISLELDDLPIEEAPLFDAETFETEEDDFKSEEDKPLIPQVYILSGGDITPFSLSFSVEDTDLSYKVSGLYSTPLTIEGPSTQNE
jgi:general secretion pathway protein H